MKYGIIAAGEGSRLASEGCKLPKPLVEINGEPMIDRLIRIFTENDAEEIVVIVNNLTDEVQRHLNGIDCSVPLKVVVKTTPSSMHSFYEISRLLKGGCFCLTTVDTIFNENEFSRYVRNAQAFDGDAFMAVTKYIDDEKPLYVATKADGLVEGFYDSLNDFVAGNHVGGTACECVSGGIYCMGDNALLTLDECIKKGMSRMRNFQRQLIGDGLKVGAYCFDKILDIDHIADIDKAENFLRTH